MKNYKIKSAIVFMVLVLFLAPITIFAGNLDPTSPPGSTMNSVESIYNQNQEILNKLSEALDCPAAPISKTGQMISGGTRDDGQLRLGVSWPNSNRFVDNGNGTITDNLTGLIWLKDTSVLGRSNWENAIVLCNNLAANGSWLTDGSMAGDWRLPNRSELKSLRDLNYYNPCISNGSGTAHWQNGNTFDSVQSDKYWTSSTDLSNTEFAWVVNFFEGKMANFRKEWSVESARPFVWPVRGGVQ